VGDKSGEHVKVGRNSKVTRVLIELEMMAKGHFIPSIGPVKGKILSGIINRYSPKRILEIGTLYGYSAILMANSVSQKFHNIQHVVTSIEVDKWNANLARKNVRDAGLSNEIEIMVGNALEVIPRLEVAFDLLFLDAVKAEYMDYLKASERLLQAGAVVVADNVGVSENEMLDYLEYVRNSGVYQSKTIHTNLEFTDNVKDAMEISVKIV